MSITVQLQDETGTVLRPITEGALELADALPPFADPDFPMLGLVDPHGNTVFNRPQMTVVLPELRRLREHFPNPPAVLGEVEKLAEECANGVHTYLVFVGD